MDGSSEVCKLRHINFLAYNFRADIEVSMQAFKKLPDNNEGIVM